MSKFNTWIPSLALAFSVAAAGIAANDHFNPPVSAPTRSLDTSALVKAVMPAVVSIKGTSAPSAPGEPRGQGSGSGYIIDGKNGYIVTNHHVVGKADSIIVQLANDKKFKAKLIGLDEKADIAVLQITSDTPLPQVSLADSDSVRLGDPIMAVGSPFVFRNTVSTGIVSGLDRDLAELTHDPEGSPVQLLIQNDASVNPGNSGGPLFNKDGKVIGMNNAIYSRSGSSAGISFAIPSNLVKRVAEQLISKGKMSWGYLGIALSMSKDGPKVSEVDPEELLNVEISGVFADSPAEKAGLKDGDIILSINGKDVKSPSDATHRILPLMAGTKVDIAYMRGKVTAHAMVTLGEIPVEAKEEAAPEQDNTNKEPPPAPMPKFGFGMPKHP
ncbi:MAG: serine endoprotease DegQ [Micavibrio sp.]|nr:serine endoprotease DegQ [Micavibrio sp.]